MRENRNDEDLTGQTLDAGSIHDRKLIYELSVKYDLRNPDVALDLYEQIAADPYYFDSETGQRFTRSLLRTAVHSDHYLENEETVSGRTIETVSSTKSKSKKLTNESKQLIKEEKETIRKNRKQHKKRQSLNKKNSSHSIKRKAVITVLIISSLFLAYYLYSIISYQVESYLSAKKIEQLISCILTPYESNVSEDTRIEDMIASGIDPDEIYGETAETEENTKEDESNAILYQYSALYERNTDMIGWIQIADTVINYPVMQTINDEEYYLKRDFDRESDINGLPFMDARNDVESSGENMIIYGHNMKNGSMFSSLLKYEKQSFYEEHPVIEFDTIYEEGVYDIVAVFQTRVAYADEDIFRYYGMTSFENEEDFESYLYEIRQLSFYDTEIDPVYGDTLLTLSTCDRRINNGRFVVVAVKRK